ncbi:MAG TPA: PIG-L family deacetylase, partial [Bryobacteraceae bacterium]|nr:PIG-L family deacetylase [Bryobacteraceae bacterium]
YESLLRLRTTAGVLHITAHPDDEDGGLLTWLSRSQGVRTGLLTLTRGEGGANLIGPELFDALGIVRTEELLAAGRYYGVDQFFTRAADFGFSKRLDETMEHWGEENVLGDCVRVVRLYRPDVIVSRFRGDPRDGHGNHQAAGRMAIEVFKAAADPNRFPEQLREGLRPWQVKKLYRNAAPDEPGAIPIDTGVYDPMIGMSYRQFASMGLSFQRSQGTGARRAGPGPSISAVVLVDSALPEKPARENSIFDGLDTSLRGLAELAPALNLEIALEEIDKDVAGAIRDFDARDPSRVIEAHIAPALRNLRAVISNVSGASLDDSARYELLFRLHNKEDEFVDAANLLAGISFEVTAEPRNAFAVVTPGQKFSIGAIFTNRANLKMEDVELGLSVRGDIRVSSTPVPPASPGYNQQVKQNFDVTIGDTADLTRPYWSRKDPYRDSIYRIQDPQYTGLPYAPPPIAGTASYTVAGAKFQLTQPAQIVSMDPALGEQRHALAIAPAISVLLSPKLGVIPVEQESPDVDVQAQVTSNTKSADVKVHLALPSGWSAAPAQADLHFTHEGEIQNARFHVSVAGAAARKIYTIQAIAESAGRSYSEGYEVIAHRDLETRRLYEPAVTELTAVDVKVAPGLKVGYIMGAGDEIPEALEHIGVTPRMLSASDLASADLSGFDTILVGIRASAVRPDYATYNGRLLDYVKNGGNLIVEYQTPEFDAIQYGPFLFRMGRDAEEVSEEDAKITVLDPSNPVFLAPNRITAADFDGWVEERGSKFMSEWAPEYKALLECHDRDQRPQKGGLLQAHYGQGTFTYAAYAFYRQLPAGVAGAYRLFANLISFGKK